MPEDSLKIRYIVKLLANLIGLAINIVTQAVIPRGLGPKSYGDFNFISNFFTQIVSFIDMGTSTCFYTKLSQRPKESPLISFYLFYFTGLISILPITFVAIASFLSFKANLWPDQEATYIYMGAVFGIFTWIPMVLGKIADAHGITVSAEIARIVQKVTGLLVILSLYFFYQLNLKNFFYYNYLVLLILCTALIWVISHKGYSLIQNWKLSTEHIKKYIKEFYHYSHPLFVYALVGLIVGIMDRWLLQKFAGSVQQGFFGLSYQIGAICFLFTSAMTPLLLREFSIAYSNKDFKQMADHFQRYIPMLYSIAAYFACFIAVQSDNVIYIFGGNKYQEAGVAVTVMAFYPIHQTYGQLSGSVFYATGQTALYRNIGIVFMLIGLPVTYFLIAPSTKMGLNYGASGLAIKMVILQILAVNVQLFFNAKLLKLSFWRYLGHQVISVVCLLMMAGLASLVVSKLPVLFDKIIARFIAAGVVYTILGVGLVYCLPMVFGLRRNDIQFVMKYMHNKIVPSVS